MKVEAQGDGPGDSTKIMTSDLPTYTTHSLSGKRLSTDCSVVCKVGSYVVQSSSSSVQEVRVPVGRGM